MSLTIPLSLFGWIPIVFLLFAILPARSAVLSAVLFAWLFLPVAGYHLDGLPDVNKQSIAVISALAGAVIFDANRLLSFRPRWLDTPVVLWCLCPLASSVSGGFGLWGGFSRSLNPIVMWGVPYFLGRVYFSDPSGLRMLARGIFLGGLIYVPFCLWEIRFAPNLHFFVYGFHQHSFAQQVRLGGFRPMVFMQHGLAVGMWMTMASLAGVWLCRSKATESVWGVSPGWPTALLVGTTVMCKSMGAILLLVVGAFTLFATHYSRRHLFMVALVCFPVWYMATRTSGLWSGRELLEVAELVAPSERVASLEGRMIQEEILISRALQRPLFGWAGWGLNREYVDPHTGQEVSAVGDGLWIIALGINGLFGLSMLYSALLLPVCRFIRLHPARSVTDPLVGPAAVLALILVIFSVDCLINAMLNPVCVFIMGALSGIRVTFRRVRSTRSNGASENCSRLATSQRADILEGRRKHAQLQ